MAAPMQKDLSFWERLYFGENEHPDRESELVGLEIFRGGTLSNFARQWEHGAFRGSPTGTSVGFPSFPWKHL
jgi:hypothetical protein